MLPRFLFCLPLLVLPFRQIESTCAEELSESTVWQEPDDSRQVTWSLQGSDAKLRIDKHERVLGTARAGQWFEELRFTCGNGTFLYLGRQIPPCRVRPELVPSLWLKSDRAGLQLMARVVFPHEQDPQTQQPMTAVIQGRALARAETWELLAIDNVPLLVERQARVLRARFGAKVNLADPYLDLLIINAYGGAGSATLAWDDVKIAGCEPLALAAASSSGQTAAANGATSGAASGAANVVPAQFNAAVNDPVAAVSQLPSAELPIARFQGSVLALNGRPMFPRVIEYRGEPFSYLLELGFNAVRLNTVPSPELLAEARQSGMWLIAPPPAVVANATSAQLKATANSLDPAANAISPATNFALPELGAMWDPVLVWSVGENLSAVDTPTISALAKQLRQADTRRSRPLMCNAESDLRLLSRQVEILSFSRWPLGSSLELTDYQTWLRARALLARPGTPFWAVIGTQPPAAVRRQWQALTGRDWSTATCEPDSLRLQVWLAVGAGARGLEFSSASRLDGADPAARLRATALAIINHELDLIEPWAAAGSFVSAVEASHPHVKAVLLQYDSSRVMLAARVSPGAQQVPQHADEAVRFLVPGVPESHEVLELTAAGAQRLKTKRITGGVSVTLEHFDDTAMILLTPDPVVINSLTRRLRAVGTRAAELQRTLSGQLLSQVEQGENQLPVLQRDEQQTAKWLAAARKQLDEADRFAQAGDRPAAYNAARLAVAPLGMLRRTAWERGTKALGSPVASPFSGQLDTLAIHWRWIEGLRGTLPQENRLPGGDMENLNLLLQTGWRHVRQQVNGVNSDVGLVRDPDDEDLNGSALRLRVQGSNAANSAPPDNPRATASVTTPVAPPATNNAAATFSATPAVVPSGILETPPLWITSPPLAVRPGEWICLRGRVKIKKPITGSIDGLMVLDSVGGEPLAERFGQTSGWDEFVLYRIVPADTTQMTVTFALTGLGEAWIDDVSVRAMERK